MGRLTGAAVAALLCTASAQAGEVLRSDVAHTKGEYSIALEMRVRGEADVIRALLTDYANWTRLSDTIRDSRILAARAPHDHRIRVVTETCVLVFCGRFVQVQDIVRLPHGDIAATVLPQLSDFRSGSIHWQIIDESEHTRVRVTAQYVPAFWVPPVIGPWAIKRTLQRETTQTIMRLEELAQP